MKVSSFRLGIALVALAAPAFAQTGPSPVSKGGWVVDGNASFSRTSSDASNNAQTSFSVTPTALVFVASRIAIGGSLGLGYAKNGDFKSSSFAVGPRAQFYLGDTASQWLPFVSGSVLPQWASSRTTAAISGTPTVVESDSFGLTLDASLGLTRLLASHVGATGEAYYTRRNAETESRGVSTDFTTNSFGLRFGLTVFLY